MTDAGRVTHISDTARWVAVYRAMESERPDALFRDPWARKLAGERGEAIVRAMPQGQKMAWPMIVRTAVMDEIILRSVINDGVDTVLNLASGLDTRAYRLPLPAGTRWVDVDFPDVIEYKSTALAAERPACRLDYRGLDLSDVTLRRELFAEAGGAAGKVLVVAEGLLVYVTEEAVGSLAADLAAAPAFRQWLIDIGSPQLMRWMQKTWGKQLRAGNSPFRFAPESGTGFFEPFGWKEAEFRSSFYESLRLKRSMRLAWLFAFMNRFVTARRREVFRRFAGIALLERT